MTPKVRKAVIPAAGLGTRLLPVTKTVPKELLLVVDRPATQYAIEEAVAGLNECRGRLPASRPPGERVEHGHHAGRSIGKTRFRPSTLPTEVHERFECLSLHRSRPAGDVRVRRNEAPPETIAACGGASLLVVRASCNCADLSH